MLKILFLSALFLFSNVASAACVTDALKMAGLDPFAVSYTPTNGFPNDKGEVEVNVEVRGSTYGGMVILCDMHKDEFISFISEYKEIGQN